uniref:Uncharacterized protein n=1 Tax=Timema monikensis TaxID=170555 RepID=A0A7R9HL70_9NEOP|nr:unnamed protein product [Timema monikensis]
MRIARTTGKTRRKIKIIKAVSQTCRDSEADPRYNSRQTYCLPVQGTSLEGRYKVYTCTKLHIRPLPRLAPDDEDSCPVICERDMRSLHRNVPALRRRDMDTSTIRQHYYPEGGWGWIVCGAGFIISLLTTGMQLSFGLLYLYALAHLGEHNVMDAGTQLSLQL